jgi:glycosyltransferase involved in cell wall biosynthesis
MLSVVIPTLNAAATLPEALASVAAADEVVVVDGGSSDGTPALAVALGARVMTAPRGRGVQLAAGVQAARGEWLLLLHADTRLAAGWLACVPSWPGSTRPTTSSTAAAAQDVDGGANHRVRPGGDGPSGHDGEGKRSAGYFRFTLDSDDPRARRLERLVAWRCRILALPYGDQGLLIHRDLLSAVGGIRPLPLLEDVDLVCRLGRRRLVALDAAAVTSAAKWQRDGWYRRSLRNLGCLALYFAGVPPHLIARLYG